MAQSMSLPPPTDSSSSKKPIRSIILDTGPLINNTISISTIIGSAEQLYTTPAIISEIRDAATRSRVETTLMPFLNIKTPTPASYEAVSAFAKKTGDFSVLSRQDLGILALAYEVHCEKHGGAFGLREEPGKPVKKTPEQEEAERRAEQKRKEKTAGEKNADKEDSVESAARENVEQKGEQQSTVQSEEKKLAEENLGEEVPEVTEDKVQEEGVWESVLKKKVGGKKLTNKKPREPVMLMKKAQLQTSESKEEKSEEAVQRTEAPVEPEVSRPENLVEEKVEEKVEAREEGSVQTIQEANPAEAMETDLSNLNISESTQDAPVDSATPTSEEDSESDDSDWITPDNLTAHQAKDTGATPVSLSTSVPQIAVATMTADYAMQNVLLQMNLNLLSPAMQRIRQIRSTILRCHACFLTTKQMEKQFCPRCGGATLARVTCSTDKKGVFRIHLSKKYQYNKRGDRYSLPKPVAGSSNGKLREKGGGQGGWGRDLVLTEDQKEYTRQIEQGNRLKTRDLMDDDYLPGILTGDRGKAGGRPKVGAGKNINSKKRF